MNIPRIPMEQSDILDGPYQVVVDQLCVYCGFSRARSIYNCHEHLLETHCPVCGNSQVFDEDSSIIH